MTLLVGAPTSEIATVYTSNSFSGFGGGVFCKPAFATVTAGTANNLITAINNFNNDTLVRCHIYRQTGNTGTFALVTSVDVPAGAAPQTTAIASPFAVASGEEYLIVFIGDVSGDNGSGDYFRASYDPTQTASSTTGLSARSYTYYDSPPATLDADAISGEADGRIFFQLDGTVGGTTGTFASTLDGVSMSATGGGDFASTLAGVSMAATGHAWRSVTFSGTIPDPDDTRNFYQLCVNDLGVTPVAGNVLFYTHVEGLTVDTSLVPDVTPSADITGLYYLVVSGTPTAVETYAISAINDGVFTSTLAGVTMAASGEQPVIFASTLAGVSMSATGYSWASVVFNGVIPDPENTRNFYQLAVNDLGITPVAGNTLFYTDVTGLDVDPDWSPTVYPNADVSGFYYVDVSGTPSSTEAFLIAAINDGEFTSTLAGVTMSAAGSVGDGVFASTLDGVTMSASGSQGISGTFASTLDGVTMSASGGQGVFGTFTSTLDGVTMAASGSTTVTGTFTSTLSGVTMSASGSAITPPDETPVEPVDARVYVLPAYNDDAPHTLYRNNTNTVVVTDIISPLTGLYLDVLTAVFYVEDSLGNLVVESTEMALVGSRYVATIPHTVVLNDATYTLVIEIDTTDGGQGYWEIPVTMADREQ